MRNWKKQWKQELDAILPDLSPAVRKEPIPDGPKKAKVLLPKRWSISAISAAACVAVLILAGILFGGKLFPSENDFVVSAVTLEINPEVTFVTDENGTVSSVVSLNSDADLILSDDARLATLMNVPLSTAVERFVEYAARAGFLDLNAPDAVRLSATGDCAEEWLSASCLAVEEYFTAQNIPSVVVAEFVALESFCERSGIEAITTKEAFEEWTRGASSLFVERKGEIGEESTLEESYRKDILDEVLKEELVNSIRSYASDLMALHELNIRIFALSLSDYFTIKESGTFPLFNRTETELLVEEMDAALAAFSEKYGKTIATREDLDEATASVVETLDDLLLEFGRLWEEDIDVAIGFVETSGFTVGEKLRPLLSEVPSDAESFLLAAKEAYTIRFESRTNAALSDYEHPRTPVDRAKLREEITAQYGSLEAFFNEKNK